MSLAINRQQFNKSFLSEFKAVELGDKGLFDSFLTKNPAQISELTFTNIFSWRSVYNFKLRIFKDMLLIGSFINNKTSFFYPLGQGVTKELIKEILRNNKSPVQFFRVGSNFIESLKLDLNLKIEEDRNNFDYIYLSSDLINLAGRKFDAKRNLIRSFKSEFDYIYREITPDLIGRCMEFENVWCTDKDCETIAGLSNERYAILNMLNNFSPLGIKGGFIESDSKIIALALGEKLDKDTFVIHAEKASSLYPGSYQLINQEFCSRQASEFKYVNREQDLGIPGLRKAKLSLQPVSLLKKFTISLKSNL